MFFIHVTPPFIQKIENLKMRRDFDLWSFKELYIQMYLSTKKTGLHKRQNALQKNHTVCKRIDIKSYPSVYLHFTVCFKVTFLQSIF